MLIIFLCTLQENVDTLAVILLATAPDQHTYLKSSQVCLYNLELSKKKVNKIKKNEEQQRMYPFSKINMQQAQSRQKNW